MTESVELKEVFDYYQKEPALEHLRKGPGIRFVPGVGNISTPKFAFVGEAPGPQENAKGIPFAGRAGQIFNDLLVGVGIVRDESYVTNVVKYEPLDDSKKSFRKPSAEEIQLSRPYLIAELRAVQPQFVVLMGNVPLTTFYPTRTSVAKAHGQLLDGMFFVTYHPSYIQYRPAERATIERDFRRLVELATAAESELAVADLVAE